MTAKRLCTFARASPLPGPFWLRAAARATARGQNSVLSPAKRRIATTTAATHAAAQQIPPLEREALVTLDEFALKAHFAVQGLLDRALDAVRDRVSENGKLSAEKIEAEQHAVHGLAWLATYVEAIKEMAGYAQRMSEQGSFGETEQLMT